MRKKINIGRKELWDHKKIDLDRLAAVSNRIRNYVFAYSKDWHSYGMAVWYLEQLQRDVEVGSINLDITYGDMFDHAVEKLQNDPNYDHIIVAMEELYGILNIGGLAQDNADRLRVEKKYLVKKGLTN